MALSGEIIVAFQDPTTDSWLGYCYMSDFPFIKETYPFFNFLFMKKRLVGPSLEAMVCFSQALIESEPAVARSLEAINKTIEKRKVTDVLTKTFTESLSSAFSKRIAGMSKEEVVAKVKKVQK